MTKIKKKIKIKKKNFTIFIIIISIITFLIFELTYTVVKMINTPKEKNIEVKKNKTNKKKKKKNNQDLEITQIIKNVNMNLDKIPYEDAIEIEDKDNQLVLVNKYNYLGENFIPKNLENINNQYALNNMKLVNYAKEAFEEMAKAAKKENLKIVAMSSYRSYSYQVDLYNKYKKKDGQEAADKYSGRPGFSEHQSGLAVDVYNEKTEYTNFESTKEFIWMEDHAHEYGFIIRFPKGKENETGYQYESWHYRYVGIEVATYIKNNNISLEEYIATK